MEAIAVQIACFANRLEFQHALWSLAIFPLSALLVRTTGSKLKAFLLPSPWRKTGQACFHAWPALAE